MRKRYLAIIICIFLFHLNGFIGNAMEYGKESGINILNGEVTGSNTFEASDDFHQIVYVDEDTDQYINYPKGYSINYSNHMHVDVTNSMYKTVLADDQNILEIYYDQKNFLEYTNYSNKFLSNTDMHQLDSDETNMINGLETRILKWHRNKLNRVYNDYNYYATAEIKKSNHEVYTLFLKSQNPIEDFEKMVETMAFFDKKGTAKINKVHKKVTKKWNEETLAYYNKYFSDDSSMKFGIFEPTAPKDMNHLNFLQEKMDYDFSVLVKYLSMDSILSVEDLRKAYKKDKVVELTFQTLKADVNDPLNKNITYDILNGRYDDLLYDYARKLKAFGKPVLFRLDNEMNGDWCLYSSYHYSKDTKLFVELWRYVHTIFSQYGVENVLWVWNPNDVSFPNFGWNHYLNYYPGDEYVDIIGLTGYNTGTYYPGEVWEEFDEIYTPIYNEYNEIFEQPFMITEFGSNSVGGDKNAWVENMFNHLDRYPRIKIAIWWNGTDWDANGNPARIYRLDTDETLMDTFKNGFKKMKK